ncbi:hypothetical protein SLS64_014070 [Diaporthe eres]|uniref:2,4-diaminopentanoate dehydrogenase C-terminal domain-containing protein n=1 Tax=Diaporthe eres TaxID=83184 RepID=A0ABR1P3W0_DIAER
MATSTKKYRVIQVATGNVGNVSLRTIIEHPLMELVGVLVYTKDKVGKDASELCELSSPKLTGIKATDNLEEILAIKADAVAYMPRQTNFEELSRILASGKNVATPRTDLLNPNWLEPEHRRLIEEGLKKGNSALRSTGSSPGTATEILPLVMLAYQRKLDCLVMNEYANLASRTNSADMIFEQMGFGKPDSAFSEQMLGKIAVDYQGSIRLTAQGLGIELDEIKATGEKALALEDIKIASGLVPKGTVAGLRITQEGIYKGKVIMKHRVHWLVTTKLNMDWGDEWDLDKYQSGFILSCNGDAPWKMHITFPVSDEYYPKFTPTLAAYPVVNLLPELCDGERGFRTTLNSPVPTTYFDF